MNVCTTLCSHPSSGRGDILMDNWKLCRHGGILKSEAINKDQYIIEFVFWGLRDNLSNCNGWIMIEWFWTKDKRYCDVFNVSGGSSFFWRTISTSCDGHNNRNYIISINRSSKTEVQVHHSKGWWEKRASSTLLLYEVMKELVPKSLAGVPFIAQVGFSIIMWYGFANCFIHQPGVIDVVPLYSLLFTLV